MAQHTIDLPCIADTWISQVSPNTNYGSATVLKGGNDYHASSDIVFRFNLAYYPVMKRIISIKLRVYNLFAFPYYGTISVEPIEPTWSEYTANYTNILNNDGFYPDTQYTASVINQYIEFDLTAFLGSFHYSKLSDIMFKLSRSSWGPDTTDNHIEIASRETANPPMLRITYEDIPPNKPELIEPIEVFKGSSEVIRFVWKYSSPANDTQKKYDLLWSINGIDWTTVTQTTPNNFYDMPANTAPAGNIYWKVRTYNQYDEVSPDSEQVFFYVTGAPALPDIIDIITNTARPTITWVATSQQIFQLQITKDGSVIYDTGSIGSLSTKKHKISDFLDDGGYVARFRVRNEYELWSPWAEKYFYISTTKPSTPTITSQRTKYGVALYISKVANASYYLIYKAKYGITDYMLIGKTTQLNYTDYTGENKQKYQYYVRAVTTTEAFSDSNIVIGNADFICGLLCSISDMANVIELRLNLNEYPVRSYQSNPQFTEVFYSGRKYPVVEMSEFTRIALSLGFAFKTYAELERFVSLYNRNDVVLYRDSKGRKVYGILTNLAVSDKKAAYSVSVTITQVDYLDKLEV